MSNRRLTILQLAALVVTFLLLVGCMPIQPPPSAAETAPAQVTFEDANGFFTVQHPAGWIAQGGLFEDLPFPNAAFATNQEIVDKSMAYELLPEGEIGVGIMLLPRALFAEAGLTEQTPLEDALGMVLAAMGDDPEEVAAVFGAAEVVPLTLASGIPAVRAAADAPTESYVATFADLGDGLLLFASQIQALGYRDATLEAQVEDIVDSFTLTATTEEVVGAIMAQMGMPAETGGTSAPTVTFTAVENADGLAYEGPEAIAGGLTRIEFVNNGEQEHSLWAVRLDEGYGIDEFMNTLMSVFGGSPEFPEWFQWYGGVTASPGNTLAYTIDLIPGNYVIFSVSGAESGEPDLARGMLSTLTVGEAADNEATPPAADLRALLVEFSFVIEGTPKPGPMIVEVANMGAEPHEIALMQLFDGAGLSDVMDFMMAGEDAEGAPPFMPAGGVAPMNAGLTGWYEADMPAGNYAIICFIPSVANEGMPHFMLGMAQEVSVEEASQ